jgi:hypothetical protein
VTILDPIEQLQVLIIPEHEHELAVVEREKSLGMII